MKMSDGERLTILMLCELQKALKVTTDFDPDFIAEAVARGRTWAIKSEYAGIFDADDDPADVSEIWDIMGMWTFVEESFERLSDADKAKVEELEPLFGKEVRFNGFDGHEGASVSIARFTIERLNKFTRFKGRELDGRIVALGPYRRMYATYKPALQRCINSHRTFTAEEIAAIVGAQRHPDHRD